MAVYKCKMCGGDLDVPEGKNVGVCRYCGTQQTVARLDDERRAALYARADHFRRNGDYDKAAGIFDALLNEDATDAESYWSLVLCKFGITYVKDPASGTMLPTCGRMQRASIYADEDYKKAVELAAPYARPVYEAEAKAIDAIQRRFAAISQNEQPYDVFVSFKDSDERGGRTKDRVRAEEIYQALTGAGLRTFFSPISLEGMLGENYEAAIFSALNSARVMIVVTTSKENVNAVWVRNEWSRYLNFIKQGEEKTLIPAYEDMSPYDLPDEFSNLYLQAQDMSKLGFLQDLVRGVRKICGGDRPASAPVAGAAPEVPAGTPESLLKRAWIFLSDGDFAEAMKYAERVLDLAPETPDAYICRLLARTQTACADESGLVNLGDPADGYSEFDKALRFSAGAYHKKLLDLRDQQTARLYDLLSTRASNQHFPAEMNKLANRLRALNGYSDSAALAERLDADAEICRQQEALKQTLKAVAEKERRLADEKAAEAARQAAAERKRQEQEALRRRHEEEARAIDAAAAARRRRHRLGNLVSAAVLLGVLAIIFFAPRFRGYCIYMGQAGDWRPLVRFALTYLIFAVVFGIVMRILRPADAFRVMTCIVGAVYGAMGMIWYWVYSGYQPGTLLATIFSGFIGYLLGLPGMLIAYQNN